MEVVMKKVILVLFTAIISVIGVFAQQGGNVGAFSEKDKIAIENGYRIERIYEDGQLIETYIPQEGVGRVGRTPPVKVEIRGATVQQKQLQGYDIYEFNDAPSARQFYRALGLRRSSLDRELDLSAINSGSNVYWAFYHDLNDGSWMVEMKTQYGSISRREIELIKLMD
jgi:hypothetical protein